MYTYVLCFVAMLKVIPYTDPHDINFSSKENLYAPHTLTAIIMVPTQHF